MRAAPIIITAIIVLGVLYGIITTVNGTTPIRDWRDKRAFRRQKANYLKAHPLHSGSEPIVWTCGCSHNDYEHDKHGCKHGGCYCKITAREVRDRY